MICERCQNERLSTRPRYREDVGLTLCMACYLDEIDKQKTDNDGVSSDDYENQQSGESEVVE